MEAPSQQQVDAALRKIKAKEGNDDDQTNLNETNFDKFSGYGGSLFTGGAYDAEDKEADSIYDAIEERQDEKRREHRERMEQEVLAKFRKERPKMQQQFADLKRNLSSVSTEEWANLPEPQDIGKKVGGGPSQPSWRPLPLCVPNSQSCLAVWSILPRCPLALYPLASWCELWNSD
jgi:pre-mRNA-processing factor 6